MDTWIDIRRKARALHGEALVKTKGNRKATALISAALEICDLETRHCDFELGLLGSLDRSGRLVNLASNQDPVEELVVTAHEIGHFKLHRDPHNEVTMRAPSLGGDPVESGAGKVEGYSPRERKEVQADTFAGEFLCPADWLRDQYLTGGKRIKAIAEELGLPEHLVLNQMIRALLLPPIGPAPAEEAGAHHDLDEGQAAAVEWDKGPLLVDAGPGTGKTRTLVRRIKKKLSASHSSEILALTFSKKAAAEMRERISAMDADASIEMWVSTFHAFGMELVTKWPSSVGRTSEFRILDQTGQLELLEANLEKLPLHHFQNLYEPAYELVPVLRVISRCKDELISPDKYAAAAKAARDAAKTEEEIDAADRTFEVAEIYRIYEEELVKADAVDFGDLVRLAVDLVKSNPDVQQYVASFKHILIDEFQDVNLASAELLKELAKFTKDIWVVADQRQSIYRFRGAEPSNVSMFTKTFGGTKHSLTNNYRSYAPVVQAFQRFSGAMGAGKMAGQWKPVRGAGGGVTMTVAPTVAAEGEAIREKIEALKRQGIPYGEQVILARTHLTLARLTGVLESLGVPLLYLGDLFERPEIRDLLSLVGIDAEFGGIGLVRVASLPDYAVPKADVLRLINRAYEGKHPLFDALLQVNDISDLSTEGRKGLLKLGTELEGLGRASPWTLLTTWLFERSNYLQRIFAKSPAVAQQQLVAIYQLLKVCGEQVAMGDPSRKRFLARVRRIEALNEDTAFRAVASEASEMDAVRVMTIHGSKGLEFSAVHFPALATGYMPSSRRGGRIEPPPRLARLVMDPSGHDAEEECLFFVGMSRARDILSLSRADKYTTRNSSPSKFLTSIASAVPTTAFRGTGRSYVSETRLTPPAAKQEYTQRELEIYMQCPARYRSEVIDGLRGGRDESAYGRFHGCVYKTVGWLEAERQKGVVVPVAGALAALTKVWEAEGPKDHPFERYYRTHAESMVRRMAEMIALETATYDRAEWRVPVGARSVLITPDRVLLNSDGSVRVQRIRTGRKTKSEPTKPIYALLRRGAAAKYTRKPVWVELLYLSTNEVIPLVGKDDNKLIAEYSDAIAAIELGDFHPDADPRLCPNCQNYFACGN